MNLLDEYNRVNSFGKSNNMVLKVLEKGRIEYTMPVEDRHMALPDVVHGGVLAGLMDAVLSVAAFTSVEAEGKQVSTVEFKINYLRAVRKKMVLKAIGNVIRKGRQVIVAGGSIYDEDGTEVATGLGTFMPYDVNS